MSSVVLKAEMDRRIEESAMMESKGFTPPMVHRDPVGKLRPSLSGLGGKKKPLIIKASHSLQIRDSP